MALAVRAHGKYVFVMNLSGDPIRVPRFAFFVYTRHGPGVTDAEVSELRESTQAKAAFLLGPQSILVGSPEVVGPHLVPLPPGVMWPYSNFIDPGSPISVSVSSSNMGGVAHPVAVPQWTVAGAGINVLAWGVAVKYGEEGGVLEGIYFGDASSQHAYLGTDLEAGVRAFIERAAAAKVLVTNSDPERKWGVLERKWEALKRGPSGPLSLSLQSLVGTTHLGVNWAYPDTAAKCLCRGDPPGTPGFPPSWETDYARDLPGDPAYFESKARAVLRGSVPIIAKLMGAAMELKIDLGSAVSPGEISSAAAAVCGVRLDPAPATHFCSELARKLAVAAYGWVGLLRAPEGAPFYIYCAADCTEAMCSDDVPQIRRLGPMYGRAVREIESKEGYLGMFDFGVVFDRKIEGVPALFVAEGLLVSSGRGILAVDGQGRRYGYGPIGLEGAATPSLGLEVASRVFGSPLPRYVSRYETRHTLLIASPDADQLGQLMTPAERSGLEASLIPIPVAVWREISGEFTRTFDETKHLAYHGPTIPKLRPGRHREGWP